MTNRTRRTTTDLRQVARRNRAARRAVAALKAAALKASAPSLDELWQQLNAALADAPGLAAEVSRLRAELAGTRLDRANLAAAAQATIGAYREGESDPLCYLRDELRAQAGRVDRERA